MTPAEILAVWQEANPGRDDLSVDVVDGIGIVRYERQPVPRAPPSAIEAHLHEAIETALADGAAIERTKIVAFLRGAPQEAIEDLGLNATHEYADLIEQGAHQDPGFWKPYLWKKP